MFVCCKMWRIYTCAAPCHQSIFGIICSRIPTFLPARFKFFIYLEHSRVLFFSFARTPVFVDLGASTSTSDPMALASRTAFGPWYDPHKYKWTPDDANEYDGGGFMVYFPTDAEKSLVKIQELKKELFIDKATRELIFIASFFNVCR